MLRTILLSLALLLAPGSLQAERYKGFPRGHALIAPAELKSLLEGSGPKPVVLAAVRQVSWLLGHVPGATPRPAPSLYRPRRHGGRPRTLRGIRARVRHRRRYPRGHLRQRLRRRASLVAVPPVRENRRAGAGRPAGGPGRRQATPSSAAPAAQPRTPGVSPPRPRSPAGRPTRTISQRPVRMREPMSGTRATSRNGTARAPSFRPASSAGRHSAGRGEGRPSEFRTAAEIGALLRQAGFEPEHDHIFYCHSGVRAATPLFALYLMGYPVERLHLYDGSWIEWSRRAAAD